MKKFSYSLSENVWLKANIEALGVIVYLHRIQSANYNLPAVQAYTSEAAGPGGWHKNWNGILGICFDYTAGRKIQFMKLKAKC